MGLLLAPGEGGVGVDARYAIKPDAGKTRVIDVRHCRGSLNFLRGFGFNLVGNWIGVEMISSPNFICATVVYSYFKLSQSFGRTSMKLLMSIDKEGLCFIVQGAKPNIMNIVAALTLKMECSTKRVVLVREVSHYS